MAGDDISLAELARRIEAFRRDTRDDLKTIQERLDQYVMQAVYNAEQAARDARIASLETRVKEEEDQRRSLSRFAWGSIVIPVAALVMTVVLALRGPH